MSATYEQLLDATIQHLEDLKSRGSKFVAVSNETLRELSQAAKIVSPQNSISQTKVSTTIPTSKPAELSLTLPGETVQSEKPPLNPKEKIAAFNALRERVMVCVKCAHLASSRKNVVFGVGPVNRSRPIA